MGPVGVLALQGAYEAHQRMLRDQGAETRQVRTVSDLEAVVALVLPGGESTTMARLAAERGLDLAIRSRVEAGLPVLGTCAGAILMATEVEGPERLGLGLVPMRVERNAFGRQIDSFVTRRPVAAHDRVFIRAPRIREVGPGVEVLDRLETTGEIVAVAWGSALAATYHPELSGDPWLHRRLLGLVRGDPDRQAAGSASG